MRDSRTGKADTVSHSARMELYDDAAASALVAHLAYECDQLMPAPLSLGACQRSLLLLTVEIGRARIVGTVSFPRSFARERAFLAEEVARRLDELQDLVGEATTNRWPLNEGTGGTPQATLDGDVLRVWFRGDDSEIRLADLTLPDTHRTSQADGRGGVTNR